MFKHGVYVSQESSAIALKEVTSGIPFVIGAAPLSAAENAATANVPILCNSWDEAVSALGYSDDWTTYPLCEFMDYYFRVCGCRPAIFCVVGEEGTEESVMAGLEALELCMLKTGKVPDLICAPGYSDKATVAAAMATKATAINGVFQAKVLVDIESDTYTDAIKVKSAGTYDAEQIVCWPMAKVGDKIYHMSTVLAGRLAFTDADNGNIPYESPSNKAVPIDGIVNSKGEEVLLTLPQANALNGEGIVTAMSVMSKFVAWGNWTGAVPASVDPKDTEISISRMFVWANNVLIQMFWEYLDVPMNRRFIDTVLNTANKWMNTLVNGGYLYGGRIEALDSENPAEALQAGIIKLHIYMTPPAAAREIDFVLEYDASYVADAFSE